MFQNVSRCNPQLFEKQLHLAPKSSAAIEVVFGRVQLFWGLFILHKIWFRLHFAPMLGSCWMNSRSTSRWKTNYAKHASCYLFVNVLHRFCNVVDIMLGGHASFEPTFEDVLELLRSSDQTMPCAYASARATTGTITQLRRNYENAIVPLLAVWSKPLENLLLLEM